MRALPCSLTSCTRPMWKIWSSGHKLTSPIWTSGPSTSRRSCGMDPPMTLKSFSWTIKRKKKRRPLMVLLTSHPAGWSHLATTMSTKVYRTLSPMCWKRFTVSSPSWGCCRRSGKCCGTNWNCPRLIRSRVTPHSPPSWCGGMVVSCTNVPPWRYSCAVN
uniref:Uncharacterized protein n=1 Tax=Cacopsylla melanoneura TaxID=428564 RepID=A0A8D9F786_9HEMI